MIFSIAFNSLLFLPLINNLLEREKDLEARRERLRMRSLLKDHAGILQIYLYIFLGVSITFCVLTIITPSIVINHLFENQAALTLGLYTDPSSLNFGNFYEIMGNNIKVVIVCYLAAFFFGAGAILVISWNASVWGTIFGTIIKNSAASYDPGVYLLVLTMAVAPYLLIEASAYFLAGISGGVVSKAAGSENVRSKRFEAIIKKSLLVLWLSLFLVIIGAALESYVAPYVLKLLV